MPIALCPRCSAELIELTTKVGLATLRFRCGREVYWGSKETALEGRTCNQREREFHVLIGGQHGKENFNEGKKDDSEKANG